MAPFKKNKNQSLWQGQKFTVEELAKALGLYEKFWPATTAATGNFAHALNNLTQKA